MIDFKTIKLVIWDLDETLWMGTLSDNDTISVNNEFVRFIKDSLDRGIVHTICSKNDFVRAEQKLISLDLWGLFVFPSISWDSKGARIKSTIEQMKLRAENVLFVDDNISNLREAVYYCSELQVCTPDELLDSVGGIYEITKIDKSRPRLSQYRIMEDKNKAEKAFSSNEDFLMSCNIRVELHYNCIENIDRIHDLLMRSNQLNYTKFRQEKEALRADLSAPNTKAAYVTVRDSFGEYGIVGFYMFADQEVRHFLFSCRILGMLVEQYVYMEIGCPKINIAGDVITRLNNTDIPKWINRDSVECEYEMPQSTKIDQKVLFKGPCDISQIYTFIQETSQITSEFTYMSDTGISVEGHNHTAQMVTSFIAGHEEKRKLLNDVCWLDEKMIASGSWQSNNVIVFSLLTDGNLGIYQHKETGFRIALCEKYYDLTDERNWDDYINGRIFTSNINFTKQDILKFAQKFTSVDNENGAVTLDNLDILYGYKKGNAKLILLLGSERAFEGDTNPSFTNRHIFHRILNNKIKTWAADKPDVYLIEIGKYIQSQRDYTDTINHFQKRIYYHVAQDLLKVINNNQSQLQLKSKEFLFWESAKANLKTFLKNSVVYRIFKRVIK